MPQPDGLTVEELIDLTTATLEEMGEPDLNLVIVNETFEVLNRMLRKDAIQVDGGDYISRRVVLDTSGAASFVNLYSTDNVQVAGRSHEIRMYWKHATTNYGLDLHEPAINKGGKVVVPLIKQREAEAYLALARLLEVNFWATPDPNEAVNPLGLKYWVQPLADGQAGAGFYGGRATGFSDVGGIAPATSADNTTTITGGQPLWRNWCAGGAGYYTDHDETLIRTMRRMLIELEVETPYTIQDLISGFASQTRPYCNLNTILKLTELAEKRNDNLGFDLKGGTVRINGLPFKRVRTLDDDTKDPIYMLNLKYFKPYTLSGWYMKRTVAVSPTQHNVVVTHHDLSYNYMCMRRTAQGVIRKTA